MIDSVKKDIVRLEQELVRVDEREKQARDVEKKIVCDMKGYGLDVSSAQDRIRVLTEEKERLVSDIQTGIVNVKTELDNIHAQHERS